MNTEPTLTTKAVRRVWAAVSASPCATQKQLCVATGLSHYTVFRALQRLIDAGYVETKRGTSRGRRIVVPFVVMR